MKILAYADLSSLTYQLTCSECATQLEVTGDELQTGDFYSGLDNYQTWEIYAKCPICEETLFLSEESIPKWAKTLLRLKGRKDK